MGNDKIPDVIKSRREFLVSGTVAGGLVLAGCTGTDQPENDGDEATSSPEPADETTPNEQDNVAPGEGENIQVGLLTQLSGDLGFVGPNETSAINLAITEIEAAGGILGYGASLMTFDSKNDIPTALRGFQTLVSNGVVAIFGGMSSTVPALIEPIEEQGIPYIATIPGSSFLDDKGGEWLWRTTTSDTLLVRPQPLHAIEQGWETMSVAYANKQGSESFATDLMEMYESLGGEVVEQAALSADSTSYRSEIETLVAPDPDVMYIEAGLDVMPTFMQNLRQLGVDTPLMGGNEVTTTDTLQTVGEDLMGDITGIQPLPVEEYQNFAESYEAYFGKAPGLFSPESYDAMNLTALALQRAGEISRQAVVDNIREVGSAPGVEVLDFASGKEELENGNEINYQGAATTCDFDEFGNVYSPVAIMRIVDGAWEAETVYSAEELREL